MKIKIKDQLPDAEIFQLIDGEPQKNKLRESIKDILDYIGTYLGICIPHYSLGFEKSDLDNFGKSKICMFSKSFEI